MHLLNFINNLVDGRNRSTDVLSRMDTLEWTDEKIMKECPLLFSDQSSVSTDNYSGESRALEG